MASTFTFIPRNVKKARTPKASGLPPCAVANHAPNPSVVTLETHSERDSKGKGKDEGETTSLNKSSTLSTEDYVALVSLRLSDYSVWSNPDLRRKIEWSGQGGAGESSEGNERYLPLKYVIDELKLEGLPSEVSEVAVAKALRLHAAETLEIRMVFSAPTWSSWSGKDASKTDPGMYEIRRKSPGTEDHQYSRAYWEERTLYMENIPSQHRSIPGIFSFVLALLGDHFDPVSARIQAITLPPHHLDKEGDPPKCKGFALVVFSDIEDVNRLLQAWPWDRTRAGDKLEDSAPGAQEALKVGFRVLAKTRWDQLKDAYVNYRMHLLDELIASEEPVADAPVPNESEMVSSSAPMPPASTTPSVPRMEATSPYPQDCLVFVRNIHPETNKTTLRTLFAVAFQTSSGIGDASMNGVDYVDFKKGMNTCHLRLASPNHARTLVEHFSENPTVQSQGLDDQGTPATEGSDAITMELVQGRREELYWENVPAKVRFEAVQKAVRLVDGTGPDEPNESGMANNAERGDSSQRKRKRRKK